MNLDFQAAAFAIGEEAKRILARRDDVPLARRGLDVRSVYEEPRRKRREWDRFATLSAALVSSTVSRIELILQGLNKARLSKRARLWLTASVTAISTSILIRTTSGKL